MPALSAPQASPAGTTPFTAHDLMKEVLQMTAQRWTAPDAMAKLTTAAGFTTAPARIYFLTQLREKVRTLPLKLFSSPETREKLLESMQVALDREIAREEVA
jgi:type III secretion system TyeA family effector delivery regulator